jgi:hypothetical protein
LFTALKAQDIIMPVTENPTPKSLKNDTTEQLIHPNKKRIWIVGGTQAALWTGSFIALNKAWYADYPKESFHLFNDWSEWQQMDKVGHAWTSYHLSRFSADMWRWTGIKDKKAVWFGGISGVAYLSVIEILDGFSAEWGFSTGDMLMNVAGAGLFVSQELGWKEQRVQLKMSYYPYTYAPEDQARAIDLFGQSAIEKILKDYNAQTYWLSANIHSFFPDSRIPRWLNLAVGYNARVMLGGTENIWTDEAGNTIDRTEIERYRRFFLSVDVDLTKIPVRNKFLRSVFSVVNMIKVPAPALEWDSRGKFTGHWFYF